MNGAGLELRLQERMSSDKRKRKRAIAVVLIEHNVRLFFSTAPPLMPLELSG